MRLRSVYAPLRLICVTASLRKCRRVEDDQVILSRQRSAAEEIEHVLTEGLKLLRCDAIYFYVFLRALESGGIVVHGVRGGGPPASAETEKPPT